MVWRVDPEPGADGLGWRLEAEPTWSRKRYQTRREVTTLADADVQELSGRVLRAVAPERRLGLELRASRLRYPGNYQSLDHRDAFGWAVLQWEPGEWSGRVRLGAQQRAFDRLRPRQRLLNGDGELQWQATPDRLLELGWQRGASDVPGDGADAVVARRLSVAWTERWGPARATLTWSRIGSAYLNGFQPRDDRLQSVDLAWRMDLARQWQVGFNLGWMQRLVQAAGADLAPHGKTTLSPELMRAQIQAGAWGITFATVGQLAWGLAHGIQRAVIANQVMQAHDLAWLQRLHQQHPGLHRVGVVGQAAAQHLDRPGVVAALDEGARLGRRPGAA